MNSNVNSDLSEDYFATEKWMLKCLGLQSTTKKPKPYVIFTLSVMTMYLILVLPELIKLIEIDFDEFINNIFFVLAYANGLLKYVFFAKHNMKLRAVLDVLQKDIFVPSADLGEIVPRKSIKDCIIFTKKLAIFSVWVGILNGIFCVTTTYLLKNNSEWKLPFGIFPTFNLSYSYEITFCYQVFVYTNVIIAFILGDLLYANILTHTHTHCKNVQYCFKNVVNNSFNLKIKKENYKFNEQCEGENGTLNIAWARIRPQLTKAILYHAAVINLAKEVEELFNIVTLATSALTTLFYCFIMYHTSSLSLIDLNFWKDVTILVSTSFFFIMLSFRANKVMEESMGVAKACYEANFVGTDIRFQKSLIFVMQRSQKPILLTVGKFANLSLITMLGIVRASYTYFMFLRQVNQQ